MFRVILLTVSLSLGILLILRISHTRRLFDINYIIKRSHLNAAMPNVVRAFTPFHDGEYNVISGLFTPPDAAEVKVSDTDITVCSQTSVGNLFYIVPLAEAWGGRISVAVFTYDDRVDVTLAYILLLRMCSPAVKQRTSFHLVAPFNRVPRHLNVTAYQSADCALLADLKIKFAEENYAFKGVKYPVNVLRNVALTYASTPYVMNIDIDLLPSYGLHGKMTSFFRKLNKTEKFRKYLYVVPSFESNSSNVIYSKKDLTKRKQQGTIRQFWVGRCSTCQHNTDYERWFSLPLHDELNVAYFVRYKRAYEPYYIALKEILPPFDGRFKQFGFNRFSQVRHKLRYMYMGLRP